MEDIPIKRDNAENIKNEELDEPKKTVSDKILIYFIIGIILLFALILSFKFFLGKNEIDNIDDLHKLNLNGKLNKDMGYVYNSYSFVKFSDSWYTQVQAGNNIWDVALRFGPKDLEDIKIEGNLNEIFLNASAIYMTFDPIGNELKYIALAIAEMDLSLVRAFNITPIAACDKNLTDACKNRPILTCENKDKAIIYYKRNETQQVVGLGNCLIIQGMQHDIVRGVDRVLMRMYGIMN